MSDLDRLRRHPDVEAPNLVAVDATDRLLLDLAAADLELLGPGELAVVGDHYGALGLGTAGRFGLRGIRSHQDSLVAERALLGNAERLDLVGAVEPGPLKPALFGASRVVLGQLPKSLAALDEIAETIARGAPADVTVYLGGRIKHLTPTMNEVLGRHFGRVEASLARQKSRVLIARGPRPAAYSSYPAAARIPELDLEVRAHGAAFGGPRLDQGTRRLIQALEALSVRTGSAVDLGCGTGLLTAYLARTRPDLDLIATDASAAAIDSTRATLTANGIPVEDYRPDGAEERSGVGAVRLLRDDAMSGLADSSVDLIVCNPPFHIDTAVHAGPALKLVREAARVLRDGGELWTVFNAHLRYRPLLSATVGRTDIVRSDARFVVTRSVSRSA